MSEIPTNDPNRRHYEDGLRPFGELLARGDVVYHGIGADLVALKGIAEHGLASAERQQEAMGAVNSNTTRELAKNADSLVSVATAPQPGLPNQAFVTYIEHSAIVFAVSMASGRLVQPADRGFYDEAFIEAARGEDIVGVVIDSATCDRPVIELPIVSGNVTSDVVTDKARGFLDFMAKNLDGEAEENRAELETMLEGIAHITSASLRMTFGIVPAEDRDKIEAIDGWLRSKLAIGLVKKYGDAGMTVLELVKAEFPETDIFLNKHDNGVQLYSESDFFNTLDSDAEIGYERFDGSSGNPSLVKLRWQLLGRKSNPDDIQD